MGHKTGVTLQRLVKQSVPPDKDSAEAGGREMVGGGGGWCRSTQPREPATCPLKPNNNITELDKDNNLRKQKQV